MNKFRHGILLATLSGLFANTAFAGELGPHVHGVASLQVAVDGKILTLDFSGPLDNLLGFEHAPHNDRQKIAVKSMADRLNQTGSLFAPSPAAQCSPSSVKLESPVLDASRKEDGGGHADIDGEYVFHCEQPENLRGLDLKLFDFYPNLHKVDVQVAGPRGQTAAKLTPAQRQVSW